MAEANDRIKRGQDGNRSHIVPKFTWEELDTSAQSCYCCRIIQSGCRECFDQHEIKESEILHASLRFFYPPWIELAEEADSTKILTFLLRNGRRFEVEIFATDSEESAIPDSWDYVAVSNRTSPGTDSAMALVTIKGWISGCITTHHDSFCNSEELPKLPTRVVDVGLEDGVVNLVETKGSRGKYICLSHCWGHTQIITTTKSTYDDRKIGIAWEELSKTFRDSISLTRTLGFNYIWIDSLCIIQDDTRDWEIESAKMASVYSQGFLTIAATHSANGVGGLFSPTPDCRVFGKTPDGEEYGLYFRERIDHHIEATSSTEFLESDGSTFFVEGNPTTMYSPLLTRAWVYQERMLSTRTLHFGRYEMFFECKSGIRCECHSIRFQGSDFESLVPLIKVEYAEALENYRDGQEEYTDAIRYHGARMWRTMVCSYTALSLTKSKDRLIAISGLAKQLASGRKSRYLAGIWEETLNDDLLWVIYTTSKDKKPRPYPYNAPTWSWASVETWTSYWDEILFTEVEGGDFEEQLPHEHFSKIEKCEVSWSAIGEFGSISHGLLTISGLVKRGILEREIELKERIQNVVHYVSFPRMRLAMKTDYLLDYEGPSQTKPLTPVICLRMSLIQQGKREILISLVLKESPEFPEYFERIGTLIISGNIGSVDQKGELFETAELMTLVVI